MNYKIINFILVLKRQLFFIELCNFLFKLKYDFKRKLIKKGIWLKIRNQKNGITSNEMDIDKRNCEFLLLPIIIVKFFLIIQMQ